MTQFGGELLTCEAAAVPGKGKLMITGKLGDVMQESAQAAMSYVRSRATTLGLERDFHQKLDPHVHFPEGTIPKDGPSAGITMAPEGEPRHTPLMSLRAFVKPVLSALAGGALGFAYYKFVGCHSG